MKKINVLVVVLSFVLLLSGCSDILPKSMQDKVEEKGQELKNKAFEELQKALSDQITDFITSTDLQKTLGLSKEDEEDVSNSLKEYLEEYDSNPQEWKNAIETLTVQVDVLKEKGELNNLSMEELKQKIKELLNNENTGE